jgi:AraC family transcriptional regulator
VSRDIVADMRWGVQPSLVGGRAGGIGAALWEWSETRPHEVSGQSQPHFHILSIQVGGPYTAELFIDGKRRFQKEARRSSSCIVPAGHEPRAVHHGAGAILHLYVPDALIREAASDSGSASIDMIDPELDIDPTLARYGSNIVSELRSPGPGHALLLDSYGAGLAVHLVRRWSTARDTRCPGARGNVGSLATWQTKRAVARLCDELKTDVTLSDLAQSVGLSPFHFARAFKAATGVAPHRFLIERRIERARLLLETTNLTITEVSARVGYDDPGYLARLFRREVGVTPARYRREHRS